MSRSFSILLAEPSVLLREKIAGVLARERNIWCVVQVEGQNGLVRGAVDLQPDFILAELGLLKDGEALGYLRRMSRCSRVVALTDSVGDAHLRAAMRLGLDDIVEKGRVADWIRDQIGSRGEPNIHPA